jgi:hypothetical protein
VMILMPILDYSTANPLISSEEKTKDANKD